MDFDRDSLAARAALHRVLGEPRRLLLVDALALSDRTPSELRELTGMASNLLAFHLDALERAGVVRRHRSAGDARRRYVTLADGVPSPGTVPAVPPVNQVLFVCTHNSARSPLAAALWHRHTGLPAISAGTQPSARVHPRAVAVGRSHGLDLRGASPRRYADVTTPPDLVVSVCDRAHEAGLPWDTHALHWSVPDPVDGDRAAFAATYDVLERRVRTLAGATGGGR